MTAQHPTTGRYVSGEGVSPDQYPGVYQESTNLSPAEVTPQTYEPASEVPSTDGMTDPSRTTPNYYAGENS